MMSNYFSSLMSQLPCRNLNYEGRQILPISLKTEVKNFFLSSLLVGKTVLMSINDIFVYSYSLLLYQLTPKDISSPLPGTAAGPLAYQDLNCSARSFSTLECLLSSSPSAFFWYWNHYQKYCK